MRKEVVATIERDAPGVQTLWRIQWPSVPMVRGGKTYFAYTYPNSRLMRIETAAKRRPVTELQGSKLIPIIRAAIERARENQGS